MQLHSRTGDQFQTISQINNWSSVASIDEWSGGGGKGRQENKQAKSKYFTEYFLYKLYKQTFYEKVVEAIRDSRALPTNASELSQE